MWNNVCGSIFRKKKNWILEQSVALWCICVARAHRHVACVRVETWCRSSYQDRTGPDRIGEARVPATSITQVVFIHSLLKYFLALTLFYLTDKFRPANVLWSQRHCEAQESTDIRVFSPTVGKSTKKLKVKKRQIDLWSRFELPRKYFILIYYCSTERQEDN